MKKIPTLFVRDMSKQPALVTPELSPGCEWVRNLEGVATQKYDGTSCMVRSGKLFKRRELRNGEPAPADFESMGTDDTTGKTVGWVPVGDGPDDKWHREAFAVCPEWLDGTYELCGPKIQGNKDGYAMHVLVRHDRAARFLDAPVGFDDLKTWLAMHNIEGLVWHHPDGRMAKIKRRDFGLKW